MKELQFDLGLKRIIQYRYDATSSDEEKKECKEKITSFLVDAMSSIVSL